MLLCSLELKCKIPDSLQLYKLVARVLREAPFALRGLYWANVYSSLNGTSRTIITGYLGIKYAVVLLQQLLKFEASVDQVLLSSILEVCMVV